MKTANRLLLLGVVSAISGNALAADGGGKTAVDLSKWQCKLCKFEDGVSGSVDVGVGHVSDSSFKFGEFTGLNDSGAYVIGDGNVRMRGPGAGYLDVDFSDLGLRSRAIDLRGGQQGKYKVFVSYEGLPYFMSDSARTPFMGNGGGSLTLPAGYPAANTTQMPLASTLGSVDLETERKRIGIGAALSPTGGWEYSVDFRHETRDGTKRTAGSFFINAAQLVEPVDYVTEQLNASASYTGVRFDAKFAYHGSRFSNDNQALTWQNPFTTIGFPGSSAGQLALPPGNQFHQLSASLGYRFTSHTRATADVAFGRMTQDESFLAPTLNALLAAPALPSSSLDARANTLNANVKLTSALTDALRLSASYGRDERDNRTGQAVYSWVTTDMYLAKPRISAPYSFKKDKVKLAADYRFSSAVRGSAGVDYDWLERTYQSVEETREGTIWGKLTARAFDNLDFSVKLEHADRDNSGYQVLPWIDPPANPLMRKYNMADRKRDKGAFRAQLAATDTINLGLGFDGAEDEYKDSPIGLTDAKDYGVNGDVSIMLGEKTTLSLFAAYQRIKSRQAGSQAYSTADWWGESIDRVKLYGLGIKHAPITEKLEVGADYTITRARSAISVDAGTLDPAFPDLSTSLDSLKLYARYRYDKDITLNAGYWYEHYSSKNWALDGVAPDSVPNVLTFGEVSPRYNVHVVRMSVRYQF